MTRLEFLNKLRGSKQSRYKYKRYGPLPLRYVGGKSLAVGHVIEHLPDGVKNVTSPFFGGGSVEIALAKELGIKVRGYDIFDLLVNYWKCQINYPEHIAGIIKSLGNGELQYNMIKGVLKNHWENGRDRQISDTDLAAYYWINYNLSFGPAFLGWRSKLYDKYTRFENAVKRVRDFNVHGLSVECSDFAYVIQHTSDFLYCDPPYYLDGDSKMFVGLYPQRNFPVHHKGFKHEILRDLLHSHAGGFILSYNDCSVIRDWYSDFSIFEVEWQYTHGQMETRIGKNRLANSADHIKKSHELLIVKKPVTWEDVV